ncbi:MAG: molybdenum cofactor guanylyltransferase [Methanobrevibacter sp.]|jgi:molybdopterin-guanine dinucleotide biosynthesis protein A|nr:molybdenum cofactor guanylyltransferase [Candidatus Methanovirga procula]
MIPNNHRTCILLCGGLSKRMGQDKGSMIIHSKPMIMYILKTLNYEIDEVIIVLNDRERILKYESMINYYHCEKFSYKIIFVEDEFKDKGPLSGIMTGLKNANSSYCLVIPCDSPYITKKYVNSIFKIKNKIKKDFDALIPYHNDKESLIDESLHINDKNFKLKLIEPLHGIYNKNIIDQMQKNIGNNKLDIKSIIKHSNTYFINTKNFDEINFQNINCPCDLNNIQIYR